MHMDGSANVDRLKDRVADDPNLVQLETKGEFYARLYGDGTGGHGYIEQARVLLLYDCSIESLYIQSGLLSWR